MGSRDTVLEEHIEVLLQQFDATMVSALETPDAPALGFDFLSSDLLSEANRKPTVLVSECKSLLHAEFENNAQKSPKRVALEYLEDDGSITTFTFGEINSQANKIANHLLSLAISKEEPIPLCIGKSPRFYISVLAVLKAGGAFTPIDPALPPSRKQFMIKELQAKIVLVGSSGAADIEELDLKFIDVCKILQHDGDASDPELFDLSESNLAYRLFTSGSTGLPKAVSIEHISAVQTLRASRSIIRWVHSSKLLQFAATTFDMCYYDIFMAWSYGFTLCSAATKYLLGELAPTIKRMGVTMLDLTPTVAATLRAYELPEVKLLYCIGEAMSQKLASDWDGRCVNSYGPTETAMCCTITDVSGDIKAANIGKPFETTKFVILDGDGKYVMPLFSSGELCIGGQQVAREYHNNPQLTRSRFISFDGDILYRTGDIARQLADGTFEFIGRTDDQVKIRGLRVELGEINMVLRDSSKDIQDASTIVLKHVSTSAKEQLVSFIALEGRKQHGIVAKVQDHCEELIGVVRKSAQRMLPRYMIPGVILVVDHIPLSAAGKVDKKTLGALFQDQDIGSFSRGMVKTEDEEWTEIERKMRDVFSQISHVPAAQIYRSSTIYEIGLDSISAAQVASRLKQSSIQISVIDILEVSAFDFQPRTGLMFKQRPSIEQISTFLEEISETPGTVKASHFVQDFQSEFSAKILAERKLDATSVAGIYPCTAAQEGMLSQFLRSQGKLYFNHTLLKLPMGTDDDALRAAWGTVFNSTDMLRAGFVEIGEGVHSFAALIYQPGYIQLPWSTVKEIDDLQSLVRMERKYAANRALRDVHLPLWGLVFIRTKPGECYLLFSGHHALYDATSLQLIFQDVRAVYEGSKIPCRPQFSGVLEGIIQHTLDPQLVENDKIFWLKQLEHSSITRMPNLCAVRVNSTDFHIKELTSTWALSRIESACQERAVSLHATGQAAWARVLSAYTGEATLTMGIVFTGRMDLKNAEEVAFPCLVALPSTSAVTGTNQQLVYDVQTSNARALKHQHTPLKSIQRWFDHPEESFFDSIFVYQKTAGKRMPWESVDEYASVDYTISLEIEPTAGDCLLIRATARDNHIPPEQTDMIIRQFEAALKDILENPQNPANDFSLIPSELLSVTLASVDKIPTEVILLHEFVQKHRRLCPDRIAFEFATAIEGDGVVTKQTWTYRQLDNEGNRFANFLRQKGVKTGDIIGISFEKCPEASFAILGILKAGCAYVALDYSAPIDRKAFIAEDSRAKMVFTMDKYVSEIRAAVGVEVISAKNEAIMTASEETPIIQDLTPDSLCYCLYTSGTTGTPKGCEITHENAVQAMMAFQRLFSPHWDADSKFLQFASFHFDVSVLEQYWSWSVGVCVTSAPRDLIFQDLAGTINNLEITHLDLTPSLGALLRPEDVPKLCKGVFITGGEALKQEILDTWGRVGCIYNGYV
jgi:amino acid adenylation domain-containing protein